VIDEGAAERVTDEIKVRAIIDLLTEAIPVGHSKDQRRS
jgi:hypothetical protein